jgi:muramoyltetrapeptide carboxypeptidase
MSRNFNSPALTAAALVAMMAAAAPAIAADYGVELVIDPQSWASGGGHTWAGPDQLRADTFLKYANDPSVHAVWFARGGYGAGRIAGAAVEALGPAARDKAYMGFSDSGYLLAGLYRAGFPHVAHGPLAQDVLRPGGAAAVRREGAWRARS